MKIWRDIKIVFVHRHERQINTSRIEVIVTNGRGYRHSTAYITIFIHLNGLSKIQQIREMYDQISFIADRFTLGHEYKVDIYLYFGLLLPY